MLLKYDDEFDADGYKGFKYDYDDPKNSANARDEWCIYISKTYNCPTGSGDCTETTYSVYGY